MAYTETKTESWGSRLGSAIKGVLVGLGLFIGAFPLLFWNEGNYIKTLRALEEGEKNVVAVSSEAVDSANEGKLVHTTGRAETQDVLSDSEFGISVNAIRLSRTVEMYQWVEESHSETKKNTGGSTTTTTTYTYSKKWDSALHDSGRFKESGHDNPASMPYEFKKSYAENVSLGAFKLSPDQICRIGAAQDYELPAGYSFAARPESYITGADTIYIPAKPFFESVAVVTTNEAGVATVATNQVAKARPVQIGDVRVSFEVILPHDVSVVAKQMGKTFVSYTAKNGKSVSLLQDGIHDSAEMFAAAKSSNSMLTWILRLVGFLMMFIGISMVLKPISVLGDVLPFLGNILEFGIGVVAFLIAAPCSLITIAVAWLYYRPLVSIPLLLVAGWLIWKLVSRKKKTAALNSANETPDTAATASPPLPAQP